METNKSKKKKKIKLRAITKPLLSERSLIGKLSFTIDDAGNDLDPSKDSEANEIPSLTNEQTSSLSFYEQTSSLSFFYFNICSSL